MAMATPENDDNPHPEPEFGDEMDAARANPELVSFMLERRSTPVKMMDAGAPAPNDADLSLIMRAGGRVPDHGKLAPWRFLVFRGDARAAMGEILEKAWADVNPDAPADLLAFERNRFLRAGVVIAVISRVRENIKIPVWEQMLSAGAVCQNMLIAGQGLGYAGQWLTEWYAYDAAVLKAMGLEPNEKIAGFLYFGTAKESPRERRRPDMSCHISEWTPPRPRPKPVPDVS
jgi:nitroreductase